MQNGDAPDDCNDPNDIPVEAISNRTPHKNFSKFFVTPSARGFRRPAIVLNNETPKPPLQSAQRANYLFEGWRSDFFETAFPFRCLSWRQRAPRRRLGDTNSEGSQGVSQDARQKLRCLNHPVRNYEPCRTGWGRLGQGRWDALDSSWRSSPGPRPSSVAACPTTLSLAP